MKKKLLMLLATVSCLCALMIAPSAAAAAPTTHTVVSGESMWRIANRYAITTSELIRANPQVSNPNLIHPGQKLNIPQKGGAASAVAPSVTIPDAATPSAANPISQAENAVATFESEVLRLVNNIRKEHGLSDLSVNSDLAHVARTKSQDMSDNNYFAHTSPRYGTSFQMIKAAGLTYRTAAENIARGFSTPEALVDAWMASSGHRANILNPAFTQIGIGYVARGHYCTQMFMG